MSSGATPQNSDTEAEEFTQCPGCETLHREIIEQRETLRAAEARHQSQYCTLEIIIDTLVAKIKELREASESR